MEEPDSPDKSMDQKKSVKKTAKKSTTKKGGKKKKDKDLFDEIDETIPEGKGGKPLNQCLPSRGVMQRLVRRAAEMKDEEEPYNYTNVQPWVRVTNKDLI